MIKWKATHRITYGGRVYEVFLDDVAELATDRGEAYAYTEREWVDGVEEPSWRLVRGVWRFRRRAAQSAAVETLRRRRRK